jgi:hypothetical protein
VDTVLRRFLYLNEQTINSYLGVIEGGLADKVTRRRTRRGGPAGQAGLGFKATRAQVSGEKAVVGQAAAVVL